MINIYMDKKRKQNKVINDNKMCSHTIAAFPFTLGKEFDYNPESKTLLLNKTASASGIETKFFAGVIINLDFFIPDVPEVLSNILERKFTLANSRYILVTCYRNILPSFWSELVTDLGRLGFVLIFLHDLKYEINAAAANTLGVLHMVSSRDVSGKNGVKIQNAALNLIKNGNVSFIGGDNLLTAYGTVENYFGHDVSETLFINNPGKILLDQSIC